MRIGSGFGIDGCLPCFSTKSPQCRSLTPFFFGNHARFQYQAFREAGLPTGSGSIESAIRRVINLRIKGAGLFWKKENAENIILIRSLVLTGKLKTACQKVFDTTKNTFYYNMLDAVIEGG